MADNCLFCRIVRKEIPANIVKETDAALVFRDINPQAPTHMLVIPKQHVASLDAAREGSDLGSLLSLAAQVARDEKLAASGYRVVINNGADGGQTVDHLHLHVLGGRRLTWPPG